MNPLPFVLAILFALAAFLITGSTVTAGWVLLGWLAIVGVISLGNVIVR